MKSRVVLFIIMAVAAWSCSPAIMDFEVERDVNRNFLKDILPPDADVGKVEVYRTTFFERLVEDENVIEITLMPENSTRERVKYDVAQQYFREVYVFRWTTDPNEKEKGANYVYFSAKFKWGHDPDNPGRARKICVGFGPSYYGKSELVDNYRVIRFNQNLKPRPAKEGEKRHYLRKKSQSESIAFVVNPGDFSTNSFRVSKVIYASFNKIGGQKSLVYDVPNVLHDNEALKFDRVTEF